MKINLIILFFYMSSLCFSNFINYDSFNYKSEIEIKNEIKKIKNINIDKKEIRLGILNCILSINYPKNKKASKTAKKYLEEYLKKDKKNLETITYLAVSYALIGRDHWNPTKKILSVKKSFKSFDEAVNIALITNNSNLWRILYLRVNTYVGLPRFFNKSKQVEKDLYTLLKYSNETKKIPKLNLINLYYNLAIIEEKKGDKNLAKNYWKKIIQFSQELNLEINETKIARKKLEINN